jgi:hypothetical protein
MEVTAALSLTGTVLAMQEILLKPPEAAAVSPELMSSLCS